MLSRLVKRDLDPKVPSNPSAGFAEPDPTGLARRAALRHARIPPLGRANAGHPPWRTRARRSSALPRCETGSPGPDARPARRRGARRRGPALPIAHDWRGVVRDRRKARGSRLTPFLPTRERRGSRSEERRVGEEGRSRWAADHLKKKKKKKN